APGGAFPHQGASQAVHSPGGRRHHAKSPTATWARSACGKLPGTTCHRGTETRFTLARCHGGSGRHHSITCHRGAICHCQGRAAGAEYDQLQHLSDTESLCQGGLLSALSLVAWFPARYVHRRSREARQVSAHVAQKGPGHSRLPGKAGPDQAARSESRGAVEREYLPGSSRSEERRVGKESVGG